jgi:hypothetical protein
MALDAVARPHASKALQLRNYAWSMHRSIAENKLRADNALGPGTCVDLVLVEPITSVLGFRRGAKRLERLPRHTIGDSNASILALREQSGLHARSHREQQREYK